MSVGSLVGVNALNRVGVAFDIDGVLIRGRKALPNAKKALQLMKEHDIPHILLTNGGGRLESVKAQEIGKYVGVEIDPKAVVLCHSPLKELLPLYRDKLVMTVWNSRVCDVAREYGF